MPSGDGIASALLTLEALNGGDLPTGTRWRSFLSGWSTYGWPTAGRCEDATGVWDAVETESKALEGRGRVLIRPSGTEPLVRVMVEAPDEDECDAITERLVAVVQGELGS